MEYNFERKTYFGKPLMDRLDKNLNMLLEDVIFSDEYRFPFNGHANCQNCCYWSKQNPQWLREERNILKKLMFRQKFLKTMSMVSFLLKAI